ncbi:DDE-domain-containing protein [Mycena venus]|uniref:DDE-domain-containing protein n=1 Tax=Mycena venus TaxID=2733690 RepID=A0A8H6X7W5_9AGAR|nr:DDE-domain-containing protein [Mycena venus]
MIQFHVVQGMRPLRAYPLPFPSRVVSVQTRPSGVDHALLEVAAAVVPHPDSLLRIPTLIPNPCSSSYLLPSFRILSTGMGDIKGRKAAAALHLTTSPTPPPEPVVYAPLVKVLTNLSLALPNLYFDLLLWRNLLRPSPVYLMPASAPTLLTLQQILNWNIYISECQAAIFFQVPRGTIKNRLKGVRPRAEARAHERILSAANEDVLKEWVKPASHSEIAGVPVGETWSKRFKERHPDLKMKWASGLEECRVEALNS